MANPGVIDLLPAPEGACPSACAESGAGSDPLDLWLAGTGGADFDLPPAAWTILETAAATGHAGDAVPRTPSAPDPDDTLIDLMLAQGISVQTLLQGGDAYIVFSTADGHSFDMGIRLADAPGPADFELLTV